MANVRGLTMVLEVGVTATSPATYSLLEGQTGITFSGAVDFADTTDKGNAGWSTSAATTRSGTISVTGNLMEVATPRTNFDLLKAAWLAGTTHNCQIIIDTVGNGWKADFYVGIDSLAGEVRDVGKYTITLTPSAALAALTPA